jgi:hypothetical protein
MIFMERRDAGLGRGRIHRTKADEGMAHAPFVGWVMR